MAQPIRVKLLTGAPEVRWIDWSQEYLTAPLLPAFAAESVPAETRVLLNTDAGPRWRSIMLDNGVVPPRHVEPRVEPLLVHSKDEDSFSTEETSFMDSRDLSFVSTNAGDNDTAALAEGDDMLTQFYEHSIAVHQDAPSSQIIGAQSSDETSFITASSGFSDSYIELLEDGERLNATTLPTGPLTSLSDIPNSSYLRSINPQTMTVNLIVGIISSPPPRTIRPRRGGRDLELIEMIVADETKAGFGINLWLPSTDSQTSDLRAAVSTVRPQDVILVRNVALSSFRNNVYGQSLRKDMTKLDLMYRNLVDLHDQGGRYSAKDLANVSLTDAQITKVRRVQEWVMQFVGGRPKGGSHFARKMDKGVHARVLLPPDTQ
ncbi:hypothetical protein MMC13_000794 [Lambiella insularis]|nr:hypothetical protein [Lambiella insularis]